jgi:HSP20 family protein
MGTTQRRAQSAGDEVQDRRLPMTMLEPVAPWLRELNRFLATDVAPTAMIPPADVIVSDQGVNIEMDVPGIRREDLAIELENDILTVRGERRFPYSTEPAERTWRHIERRFGRFQRSMRVPGGLDPNSVQAALHDGVLSLQIPRPQRPSPQRVEIREGEAAQMQQPAQPTEAPSG